MIYTEVPLTFNPRFEIVSCFFEVDGKILLLHRHDHKSQGGKWGVPAGKVDPGEELLQAMNRELREETGIRLESTHFNFFNKIFVRHGDYDFVYHMYHVNLSNIPEVRLSESEHQRYTWVNPSEALNMNLVDDLDECIKMFYKSN